MAEDDVRQEKPPSLLGEGATVIHKNASEVVVIEAKEFGGLPLVDVRVWTADPHGTPDARTKKGLCLRPTTWAEVLPAIQQCLGEPEVS